MKLKTKLTLSVSLLVLVVVLAVNVVYLAGIMREQLRSQSDLADFLSRQVFNQISQELAAANAAGKIDSRRPETLRAFFQSLNQSPALAAQFSSDIGYGVVRDVALVDPNGVIVADSNPLLQGTRQPDRLPLGSLVGGSVWHDFGAIAAGDRVYQSSLPLVLSSMPLGSIQVGIDTVLLRSALAARIRSLALSGALIVLLATFLSLGLSELVLAPLTAISAQLDRLMHAPEGGESARPGPGRRDEYGVVSSKIERLGKQMEDARQVYSTLQENVAQVLESLEEGLLLFDAQGHCVMASAAAARLLELPAAQPEAEIVGRPVEELFYGSGSLDAGVREAVRTGRMLAPLELERRPGARPLLVRLDRVPDKGGGMASLLTVRDAAPVRRLESQLEVAHRLAAVGRLTRGVAHEVKNPLNAMAIHLDLLREKAGPGARTLQPHIEVIGREIERLDRKVKTFLDFSRPVELRLVTTDLGALARSVGQLVTEPAQSRGMAVEVVAPASGPQVWMDRDLIEQALLNLVNNGLQAMEELAQPSGNGHVPAGPRAVRLEVFQTARQAAVRIRDYGPGVPAEIREKIFDLYFTTRPEGTGIGLALAARIMQLHHGAIELEVPQNGDPAGASFLLRFPLRLEQMESLS